MRFDDYELEMTAEVLLTINECYANPMTEIHTKEQLISFMRSMAYQYLHDDVNCRNFSTGGFNLSTYRAHDGELVVRANVTAYAVKIYLARLKKRLDNVLEAA